MGPTVDASTLKQKLAQTGPGNPVEALAALTLEQLLDAPVGSWLSIDDGVKYARQALQGWLSSDDAVPALNRLVERLVNELGQHRTPVKDVISRDVRHTLRDIVGRPMSPDRAVVLTLIDRDPTRELVRQLLLDAILDFGRKVSAPVSGVAKGLGSLAKLATDTVKSRGGGLGSLVGAVSGEVERQLEKRAVEFVDAAMAGIFGQIADAVSDPRRATEAAELRVAVFDGAMTLTLQQLSREVMNADVPGAAETLRSGLRRWLASAESDAQLRELITFAFDSAQRTDTFRHVLAQWGLLEVARAAGLEWLQARFREVLGGEAFGRWLEALFT